MKLRILSWEDGVDGLAAGDAITKVSVRGRRWRRGGIKGGGVRVTADVPEEVRKLETTLLPVRMREQGRVQRAAGCL